MGSAHPSVYGSSGRKSIHDTHGANFGLQKRPSSGFPDKRHDVSSSEDEPYVQEVGIKGSVLYVGSENYRGRTTSRSKTAQSVTTDSNEALGKITYDSLQNSGSSITGDSENWQFPRTIGKRLPAVSSRLAAGSTAHAARLQKYTYKVLQLQPQLYHIEQGASRPSHLYPIATGLVHLRYF